MEYIATSHLINKDYFLLFSAMHDGLKGITVVFWTMNITRASILQGLNSLILLALF